MRLSPLVAVAAACVLTLTACGDDDSDKGSDPKPSESTFPMPTDFPTDIPTETTSPPDTKGLSAAIEKVCDALDPADVGEVLGGKVTANVIAGTGCTFTAKTPQAQRTAAITFSPAAAVGGLDGFKQALAATGGGQEPEDVPDVGDGGFVVTIDAPTGSTAAAGMVADDIAIQLFVTPGSDSSTDDAKAAAIDLMNLVDAAL